jgi:hypothetical protein
MARADEATRFKPGQSGNPKEAQKARGTKRLHGEGDQRAVTRRPERAMSSYGSREDFCEPLPPRGVHRSPRKVPLGLGI